MISLMSLSYATSRRFLHLYIVHVVFESLSIPVRIVPTDIVCMPEVEQIRE